MGIEEGQLEPGPKDIKKVISAQDLSPELEGVLKDEAAMSLRLSMKDAVLEEGLSATEDEISKVISEIKDNQ